VIAAQQARIAEQDARIDALVRECEGVEPTNNHDERELRRKPSQPVAPAFDELP
jgi:hypothetical protein